MRSPQTHSLQRSWCLASVLRCVLILSFQLLPTRTIAQHTEPIFGIADNQFLIGGWNLPPPPNVSDPLLRAQQSIQWARQMGVNVFRLAFDYDWNTTTGFSIVDGLMNAADTTNDIRFFITNPYDGDTASFGREAKFYLIPDSVPFKDWKCRFLFLNGGVTNNNPDMQNDWRLPATERLFRRDSVAVNTRIADSIVINWLPERTSWWSRVQQGNSWCTVPAHEQQRLPERLFGEFWSIFDKGKPNLWGDSNYVVVTGHLYADDDPQAHPDSTVLWIDLFYDIGEGERFRSNGNDSTALTNRSQRCTTLAVRQRHLARQGGQSWNEYQTVSLPFSTRWCTPTFAGPLNANAGISRRINLSVRYAGNASVAIRSIALRDSIANNVLTENAAGIGVRNSMRSALRARITPGGSTPRESVIGIAINGEQSPVQTAAVARVTRWLHEDIYQTFDSANSRTDTLNFWIEGLYNEGTFHQATNRQAMNADSGWIGRLTTVAPEYLAPQDRRSPWKATQIDSNEFGRGAIFEHNGGKFMLPELLVNAASVERFERQVQLRHLQQYLPNEGSKFPFQTFVSHVARLARDQRKRMIAIPFVSNNIWIHQSRRLDGIHASNDSIGCDRILEPAEIRGAANLSIALGATGIFWQVLSHGTNFLAHDAASNVTYGTLLDWPLSGGTTADTTQAQDRVVGFQFTTPNGSHSVTMPDTFWTGWRIRSKAVKEYNRWLKRVGPELVKLRWRDAYSVHAQRSIPYRLNQAQNCIDTWVNYSTAARAIPSTEFITRVNARSLSGQLDPDSSTYVEVGLFDMKLGRDTTAPYMLNPMKDTQFVWVANRRVFELTDDITDSARRAAILALTGTRTIELKLNLMNKGQFVFCRVTEVEPDTSRLPGANAPRAGLDTVLAADSIVKLKLGPGRASLLRVTYVDWETDIINARIDHSNQRKIVWDPDQGRYHCVYMKPHDSVGRFDQVCYRRSKITPASGSILWEKEYVLSSPRSTLDSLVFNRHPALTIRRVPNGNRTVATVVWTAHRTSIPYAFRQVLLRVAASPDLSQSLDTTSTIEVVDSACAGDPDNRWGTPVVSRLEGADVIAWSDSMDGIKARARVIPNPTLGFEWWREPPTYTDSIHVSAAYGSPGYSRGIYPSVPTFAHIVSRDSNIALVWEQPIAGQTTGNGRSDIYYKRLQHTLSGANDTLVALDSSFAVVSNAPGVHRNPSISQHQDFWRELQDVVVWESTVWPTAGSTQSNYINARSVFFESRVFNATNQPDTLGGKPQLWGWVRKVYHLHGLGWLYPNVASVTYRDSMDVRKSLSTIAHRSRFKTIYPITVKETGLQWADVEFKPSRQYTYSGYHPTNSETPTTQSTHHALLYENDTVASPNLLTSREFFLARGRPVGYTAQGRELAMRMNDTSGNAVTFLMADPWTADADTSFPIRLLKRDTTLRITTVLSSATSLLRTQSFAAGDSTVVGISLTAAFHGDTTGFSGTSMRYVVELIDTATNARVHLLDSFAITTANRTRAINVVDTLDLVSSRYFIRAIIDTIGVSVPAISNDSRYPVSEIHIDVIDSLPMYRPRRLLDRERSDLRVTAHPNPSVHTTEARFTVPRACRVRVVVSDHDGKYARTLLDEWMEEGRYALDIDTESLTPGRYVVQVHAGNESGIVKVLVLQ